MREAASYLARSGHAVPSDAMGINILDQQQYSTHNPRYMVS